MYYTSAKGVNKWRWQIVVVDAKEVQQNFDKYIEVVERGEIVHISENGKIIAELQPINQAE